MSRPAEKPRAATHTWVDAGSVRIQRAEGKEQPLFLKQQGCDGELGGRPFNASVNVGVPNLIVCFEAHKGDHARTYVVQLRDVLQAIADGDDELVANVEKRGTPQALTQTLALALTKLDVDAAAWAELDVTEVSQVTDEHLALVLAQAEALQASAAKAASCVRKLQAARKAGGR